MVAASVLGVKWQNILTTSNPSLQLIEGAVYIIGYDANYARQGFIRVQNNVVEYVLKPYSFDTYISLTSDNSVLTATFLKSAITSMAIRQLLVTI